MKTVLKKDIIKNLSNSQLEGTGYKNFKVHDRARRRISKVMFLYFKYMFEVLLEKKVFVIRDFGRIEIQKRIAIPNQLKLTPSYYKDGIIFENTHVMNKKMVGEVVTIVFTEGIPVRNKIRFKACFSFRKHLSKLLRETDFKNTIELCQ